MRFFLSLIALLLSCGAGGAIEFFHRSPDGIKVEVTGDGLTAIRLGEREVATGSWSVFNGESWFKDGGSNAVATEPAGERVVEMLDDQRVRVRQTGGDLAAVFDYRFTGGDVFITARIENNHQTEPLRIVGFRGLTFHFDQPPEGLMPVQHISYFQTHGAEVCHPSHWQKIGGSYATDGSIGVGFSPSQTGFTRTLTLWDYTDWAEGRRDKIPERALNYFVVSPVPPRGAATFEMRLRVSTNRDWRHLLEPYREHFRETYGAVRYKADPRWIAADYLNRDPAAITRQNPYGFHPGNRRFDQPKAVSAFTRVLVTILKKNNGQGVLLWGHGGEDPRGQMYRPDFDILPPEVEAAWPQIARPLASAQLHLGVATRPNTIAVRETFTGDQVIALDPDDDTHREMLWRRFERMRKLGCSMFYLDSFGSSLEDVKLMRFLRERLGPDVQTFAEHQCDAIMPYSGAYSETDFLTEPVPHYELRSGLRTWEIYQWLVPGSQMISRLYEGREKIPRGFEPFGQFVKRNKITPLIPLSSLSD